MDQWGSAKGSLQKGETECGRRPPTRFFELLDQPRLDLLNIKFPLNTKGKMFLDVVSAAKSNCRVGDLKELALAGGGWWENCPECGKRPSPSINPIDLRMAMNMLLPMPHLKLLRLSVAPNFLDVLDLDLYRSMADGLPALEKLWLGHREFAASSEFNGTSYYERVPLHHLAAFCKMLPNLVETSVGCADGMTLQEQPNIEWECSHITKLRITHWAGDRFDRGVSRDLLHLNVRSYFPNSDLAREDFSERYYIFQN